MKVETFKISLLLMGLFLYGCTEPTEKIGDADADEEVELIDKKLPGVEGIIFENEYVEAIRVKLEAGERMPWHEGGPRVIYAMKEYKIRFEKNPDDTVATTNDFVEGEVHWYDQNQHAVVNVGETPAEFMVFMRKPVNFPDDAETTTQADVEQAKPGDTNVLLENDVVKVILVRLPVGEKTPMRVGTRRLIFSLTDYTIVFHQPDQSPETEIFEPADIHWHEGGEHSIENTGEAVARFITVEFKK